MYIYKYEEIDLLLSLFNINVFLLLFLYQVLIKLRLI